MNAGTEAKETAGGNCAPAVSADRFDAGVFDLDGVVTRTARLHAAAWKQLFDDFLRRRAARTGEPFQPFSDDDYRRHVDGKPRLQGIRGFLEARGISLPDGADDNPDSIFGLARRKNALFQERLTRDGVEVYESTVDFIRRLRKAGLKTALVSSSKNAAVVLAAARLADLFDVTVDGVEAARLHLRGKPDPDIFLHALKALSVAAKRAFAVEDALSGVAAARAAGYGLVIGLDRGSSREELHRCGADIVVDDLSELAWGSQTPAAGGRS